MFIKVLKINIANLIIVLFIQSGDDTTANTSRLCLKAARPVRKDLLLVSTIPLDLIYQCDHNFPFPLISLNPKGNGDGRRWNHMWSSVRLPKQGCRVCWGTQKVLTWRHCFKYLFSTLQLCPCLKLSTSMAQVQGRRHPSGCRGDRVPKRTDASPYKASGKIDVVCRIFHHLCVCLKYFNVLLLPYWNSPRPP